MKPRDNAARGSALQDANRILRAIDDAPTAAGNATSYALCDHELRILVEELGALCAPKRVLAPVRVWLLWNRAELVGSHDPEAAAHEARDYLQHQLRCDDGPDAAPLASITTTATAAVVPAAPRTDRVRRP